MRPFWKVVLITLGVMAVVYGVYLLLGRPPIPLPAYRLNIGPDHQLYPIVKATESDEIMLTFNTNGNILATSDGKQIAAIDYTPETLNNAIELAEKYLPPAENQNFVDRFLRSAPSPVIEALFHTIRLKMAVIISANP